MKPKYNIGDEIESISVGDIIITDILYSIKDKEKYCYEVTDTFTVQTFYLTEQEIDE